MLRPHRVHVGGEELLSGINDFLNNLIILKKISNSVLFVQVRQWQHWGSGCYNYVCEDNRLHIIVLNSTYTCFYGGQELKVQTTWKILAVKISLTLFISDSAEAR